MPLQTANWRVLALPFAVGADVGALIVKIGIPAAQSWSEVQLASLVFDGSTPLGPLDTTYLAGTKGSAFSRGSGRPRDWTDSAFSPAGRSTGLYLSNR